MDSKENVFNNPWVAMGLPALTILVGIQVLRALFPGLVYVLGDWYGWSAIALGGVALLLFASSLLASLLRNLLGSRVLLIVVVVGLGLTRLALQLWPRVPLAHLLLAGVGTLCFLLFFPVYLAAIRPLERTEIGKFGLGIQVGLILSVLLNGMYNTYELTWQSGFLNSLVAIIIVFLLVGSLAGRLYQLPAPANDRDAGRKSGLLWLCFGPFLFLQMLLFANIAQISATTGWDFTVTFVLALVGALLGFFGAAAVYTRGTNQMEILIGGGILLIVLILTFIDATATVILFVLGPLMTAEWLMVVLLNMSLHGGSHGSRHLTVGNALGWLLFAVFVFLFYAVYQISLPLPNTVLPALALAIVFGAGLTAYRQSPNHSPVAPLPVRISLGSFVLIVVLVAGLKTITWTTVTPLPTTGEPLRIMTYNLHNGINPWGQLDLEAIAQAIEAENPDVIGLQEVSRGWIVNGSVDTLLWLSQRLEMPYVWGPTEGDAWGNAILSRHPFNNVRNAPLPPEDLLLGRGFINAEIDTGDGPPLQLFVTHYHHVPADSDIRLEQSQALLAAWRERPRSSIIGDLNAQPGSPELDLLSAAGFLDAIDGAGLSPGNTYSADDARVRLDYIWHTPDLATTAVNISTATASDHLPVAATVTAR